MTNVIIIIVIIFLLLAGLSVAGFVIFMVVGFYTARKGLEVTAKSAKAAVKSAKSVSTNTQVAVKLANQKRQVTTKSAIKKFKISPLPAQVKKWIKEARTYGTAIIKTKEQCPPSQERHLNRTIEYVNELLSHLEQLEYNLERLYTKRNLNQELKSTTAEISELKNQSQEAEGPQAKILQNILQNKEKHLLVLNKMKNFQQQIELSIRQNASTLNSTHAEITYLLSRGELDKNKFHRLNQNVQEQSDTLIDLLEAMEEENDERYQ